MKNVLVTIPKSKYPSWVLAEADCASCTGEGRNTFWLVNMKSLPNASGVGAQCFMVYDGLVRGYFDIVDSGPTESYRSVHGIGRHRTTQSLVLANWHPIAERVAQVGFMGCRYTELRP
jgi:hypothetical protein